MQSKKKSIMGEVFSILLLSPWIGSGFYLAIRNPAHIEGLRRYVLIAACLVSLGAFIYLLRQAMKRWRG